VSFNVDFPDEAIGKAIRLGSCLPDFSIKFFNSQGSAATVDESIEVTVTCPELSVQCDSIPDVWTFEVNNSCMLD
jgi:hypothetical protein